MSPDTAPHVDLVVGARPNFVKAAAICAAHRALQPPFTLRLVHTGQHYDYAMSGTFFAELGLPQPDVYLGGGGGTAAEQTGAIMVGYERVVSDTPPVLTIVVGDVTSTMACAIVARKAGVPVAHVEGGLRSRDWTMPEEINRVVTDAVADWFFTTSVAAGENLRQEGVAEDRIWFVGNTMIDTLLAQRAAFAPPPCWHDLALAAQRYVVLTLHRPANVDTVGSLEGLLAASAEGLRDWPIVFPVHPRTAGTLRGLQARWPLVHCVDPLPYREFGFLLAHAAGVITDSGGVTEEATVLGIPCLTVRNNTERPETVTVGTNELIGTDSRRLVHALERLRSGRWKSGTIPERWDGRAGLRIMEQVVRLISLGEAGGKVSIR